MGPKIKQQEEEEEKVIGSEEAEKESLKEDRPIPPPIDNKIPPTITEPNTQSPDQSPVMSTNKNKKQKDAPPIPPHMVQKFMQQIQRLTEHHNTELSTLQQKLEEKDAQLQQL